MAKYRIVTDTYLGYEVQWKRWYWPFWSDTGVNGKFTNTFRTVKEAEDFAHLSKKVSKKVIKYL